MLIAHTGADDCPCAVCQKGKNVVRYERTTRMSTKRTCALCGGIFYLGHQRRQREDGRWVHRSCEQGGER